jgi:hypothetical protein
VRMYQTAIQIYENIKVIMVLCIDEAGILAEMGIFLSYRLYSLSYTLSHMHSGREGAV